MIASFQVRNRTAQAVEQAGRCLRNYVDSYFLQLNVYKIQLESNYNPVSKIDVASYGKPLIDLRIQQTNRKYPKRPA